MSDRCRLLCCSSTMDSGGSERQMWNLLRGLDRQLFFPSLYLLYRQGPLLQQLSDDIAVEAFWDRHATPRCNWPGRMLQSQICDLSKYIIRTKTEVAYQRLFHMALIVGPACRKAKVPHVATIVSPPQSDVPRSEIKLAWLKRWFLSRSYSQATRLLAVSQAAAVDASRYYRIPMERFEVVWNPVDVDRIDRLRNAKADESSFGKQDFHIVSIGRLSHEKGHRMLLEAIVRARTIETSMIDNDRADVRPIKIHLIGDGPEAASLNKFVRSSGLDGRVIFHGYCDNPFPLLQHADLFVLPSFYEGMPNVLLEAMACEVPTIATCCPGGIREATDDGKLSILSPVSSEGLADAIVAYRRSPNSYKPMVPAARAKIVREHSYPVWLQRIQTILLEAKQSYRRG